MRQAQRLAAFATHLCKHSGSALLVASAAFIFTSGDAHAVMRGHGAGSIAKHVVKLVGHNLLCTATVIARQQLLTANHCVEGSGPFFVIAGSARIAVASHSPSGQTTLLTLASPLPSHFVPIAMGSDAGNDSGYTIAGYGTAREAERMHSAGLKEARLVADSRYGGLVDPNRRGPISASACMGDSGGPVAKFDGKRYVLVGIVERVSNYAGIGACGFLTHFSAVSGNSAVASAPAGVTRQASEPRHARASAKKQRQWAAVH
jgi:secreted trypsin-like serine protease